jgi:hypothetical protein
LGLDEGRNKVPVPGDRSGRMYGIMDGLRCGIMDEIRDGTTRDQAMDGIKR